MAFDPNQPFEVEDEKGGFDPTKEFTPLDTDSPSQMGVAARAVGQGLAFGFGDEAVAGIKAPFSDKSYTELRDENRAALERDREAYPKTAIAGEITGAVLPSIAATLASGPVGGGASVANAGRLASVAKSVFNPATVKGMMGAGAAYGLGSSEADLTEGDVGGAAADAGKSALFAGALGKALPVVGKYGGELLEGTGKKLGQGAEFLASKAVGLTKGLRKRLDMSPEGARAVGREALESGVVTPFADSAEMATRAEGMKGKVGKAIGSIVDEASATGVTPDYDAMIEQLYRQAEPYAGTKTGRPIYKQFMDAIDDLKAKRGFDQVIPGEVIPGEMTQGNPMLGAAGQPRQLPSTRMPDTIIPAEPANIRELADLKQVIKKRAFPEGVPGGESKEGFKSGYRTINEGLEESVSGAAPGIEITPALANEFEEAGMAPVTKNTEIAQVYEALKAKYGKSKNMITGLKDKLAAEEGNRFIRPTDFLVGGAFGLGGGILPGVASVVAKRGIEKYGHQVGAVTMDKISKVLSRTPQALGAYGPVIQQAIQRGGTAFATQNFLLQQRDPEYRQKIEELSNMPEGEE